MTYTPLHVHDSYGSIGDAILKIPDYIKRAKEYGCPAAAITNHGSLSTFVSFYEECRDNGIKPVIGCEFYLCIDRLSKESQLRMHIILLAKNYEGLKNLIMIHNDSQETGFYYKPRVDLDIIDQYKDNLICLTACVGGPLGFCLKKKWARRCAKYLLTLKEMFKNDLYLEIQPGGFKDQIDYNDFLVQLAKDFQIEMVATNDIHYLCKEDYAIHNWHVRDCRKYDDIKGGFVYPDTVYYLMKEEELKKSFYKTFLVTDSVIDKAVENTNVVAEKVNIILPEEKFMPVFDQNMDEQTVLEQKCYTRLDSLMKRNTKRYNEYKKRLDYELDTIRSLGFAGYFLIVKDIIDYCDDNDIARGPGRGSCAGSLVSFLLNISVADPIKYGLMFERFLSVHRTAIPDIDLDIVPSKKAQVYDYIINKYGKDFCCFVSTFNIRKAKNAVKTACRLLDISPDEANSISALIPDVAYDELGNKQTNISVEQAYRDNEEFRAICQQHPKLLNISSSLEGYPSSMGVHPAGIVISPVSIVDRYPLMRVKDPETKEYRPIMATSLDLHDVEKLSGVKFDLLSLSSLDVIYTTMKNVGIEFDFNDDELLSDSNVWRLISSKYSAGLFQISSETYRNRMPQLHPQSIQELAACLALVRGPCISSGMDKVYMDIINGKREEEHIHEIYWEATKDTHGVLIYQEQILKICMNIGFSSETAYDILKAVSKKKVDKIKSYQKDFYELGKAKDISLAVLNEIWRRIEDSGLYAFNIAHATSYALVCYLSAYLKYYYTTEYFCNLLSKEAGQNNKKEVLYQILDECRKLKIEFLPPDINKSGWNFSLEDDKIRLGFCSIKGIGESVYKKIKEAQRIKSFTDFIERVSGRTVNKKAILILIAAGVFSCIESMSNEELAMKYMLNVRKEKDWDGSINIGAKQVIKTTDSRKTVYKAIFGSELYM